VRRAINLSLFARMPFRVWRASKFLERETGIEPATNSLEGCDSTTELLPPISAAKAAYACTCNGTAEAMCFHKPMEPMTRIELVTSPLPRECSTN
jgi:hypothetical protein